MIMKTINFANKNSLKLLNQSLNSRRITKKKTKSIVEKILFQIKSGGDQSLIKIEQRFIKKKIRNKDLFFSKNEIRKYIKLLDTRTRRDIDLAFERVFKFHKKQKIYNFSFKDQLDNKLGYRSMPIQTLGIYVPGGKASYPSSVIMNCVPALVAKVENIYMCFPCLGKEVNPAVIYAATKCKVKKIFKIGGAQAIGAMAYGTKIVPKVDKIVGPGNEFVTYAKKEVFGEVGIDNIAGPSEVTIVADTSVNPSWIAADLIAQAEHDENSQCILISPNENFIKQVNREIKLQLFTLPKRNIAEKSLYKNGLAIYSKSLKQIADIINLIAPEHLELVSKNNNKLVSLVKNAGSIFLDKYSPEAMGDYLAGPNHVLPTSGSAKYSSGLSVLDFIKRQSIIKISKRGIERLGSSVINLANFENLQGHANSIKKRLEKRK